MRAAGLLLAALLAGTPVAAQSVADCTHPAANAQFIYAPFDQTIRDFAGGTVRLTALDEGPDARGSGMFNRGAYHLMITTRRADGAVASCALISARGSEGFFGLGLDRIVATQAPESEIRITLPVDEILGGDMVFMRELQIAVIPQSGAVTAQY